MRKQGDDDLGSEAVASMTYLPYTLRLRRREEPSAPGPLEMVDEHMEHINRTEAVPKGSGSGSTSVSSTGASVSS